MKITDGTNTLDVAALNKAIDLLIQLSNPPMLIDPETAKITSPGKVYMIGNPPGSHWTAPHIVWSHQSDPHTWGGTVDKLSSTKQFIQWEKKATRVAEVMVNYAGSKEAVNHILDRVRSMLDVPKPLTACEAKGPQGQVCLLISGHKYCHYDPNYENLWGEGISPKKPLDKTPGDDEVPF